MQPPTPHADDHPTTGWVTARLALPLDEAAMTALAEAQRLLMAWADHQGSKATSVRLNERLHDAATLAVREGWAPSFTALVEAGLATHLGELLAEAEEQVALDQHYRDHPDARPDLWAVALAAARIDADPIADHPDLLERAVAALGPDAHVDAVLAWAAGALASAPSR